MTALSTARAELDAFGEYQSKRKALEEFERFKS